jgi:cation transport regulator ChaC
VSLAVFAYGSLVSRPSAAATLERGDLDLVAATLTGRRRAFTLLRDNRACEKTFARRGDDWVPDHVLALDLVEGEGGRAVNGALLSVTAAELDRLDRREIRYRRIEVTAAIGGPGTGRFERVFTYVAKPEHHAPEPPATAVVIAAYEQAVEAAFAELSEGELDRYRATTERGTAERIDAYLVTGSIPSGNPRSW